MRVAAEAFLNGLSEEQRKKTVFPVDDKEWRKWDNRPFPPFNGVRFKDMSERQRELAFDLVRASLSAKGLQKTTDIMKLNETYGELRNNLDVWAQWLYWITVMGKPSDTEPWGWQMEGHHLAINYFVLGDQVVMTPTFMGTDPIRAESGKFKGTVALEDERNKGFKLFAALSQDQQSIATLRKLKKNAGIKDGSHEDNLAEAYKDNLVLEYAGIRARQLNGQQQKLLMEVIEEYVGNMREGHTRARMDEVRRHLDGTYFAWIGSAEPEGIFYYRIHSPVILIEFDHVSPNHIHTVVRTPNGNDYGKDLLRQHYERHPHGGPQDHVNRR